MTSAGLLTSEVIPVTHQSGSSEDVVVTMGMTSRLSVTLSPSAGDVEDSSYHESGFTLTPEGGVMAGGVQEEMVRERAEVLLGRGQEAGDHGSGDEGSILVEASGEAPGESSGLEPKEGPLIEEQTPVAVTDGGVSETPDSEEPSTEVTVTLLPDDLTLTSEAMVTGHSPTPTAPQESRADVEYSAEPPVTVETDVDADDVTDEEHEEAAAATTDSASLERGHSETPTPTTMEVYAGWTVVVVEEGKEEEEDENHTHSALLPDSQSGGDIGKRHPRTSCNIMSDTALECVLYSP